MFTIIIIAVLLYLMRTVLFYFGAERIRRRNTVKSTSYQPMVSILVPARNEEDKIESSLRSILQSNYPKDRFEIIAINDRSEDKTLSIMQSLAGKYSNIKIVNLTEPRTDSNLRGKPGALHHGSLQASGEVILMTDADCIVNPDWILTMAQNYKDPELGLQASFTLIEGNRIFDLVQAVEWIYMHTMASAGMGLNQPLGCYGNNLSIRRSVYENLGGYPKIPFSITEDMALERAVFYSGNKINYLTDIEATVTTLPCQTMSEYMSQHRRWAIGGLGLGWRAVAFTLSSVSIWAGIALSIYLGNPLWLATMFFTRIAGDFAVILPSAVLLKQNHLLKWIVPSVFFFMIIELILPFTLFSRKVKWKGQIFGK